MTGFKENLSEMAEKESHLRVVLGDDANNTVKGSGATSLQLEYKDMFHLNNVLYVPSMKRNIVSISALENKGLKLHFLMGKCLLGTRTQAWTQRKKLE